MSNRRKIRPLRQDMEALIDTVARTLRCPDCNSEIERWRDGDGLDRLTMRHDDSCPYYRGLT